MKKLSILIVDDEKDLCEIIVEYLNMMGHEAQSVHSGNTAIELLRINPDFHIVVSDIHMVDGDGLELLSKVIRGKSIFPVVFLMSGHSSTARETAINNGAHAFFNKPLEFSDLLASIEKVRATHFS